MQNLHADMPELQVTAVAPALKPMPAKTILVVMQLA